MHYIAITIICIVAVLIGRIFYRKYSESNKAGISDSPPAIKHAEENTVTPAQVELLQKTWQMVLPHKEIVAEMFYNKLFEMDPSVRPMFKNDMKRQGDVLISTLTPIVHLIDKADQITPILEYMGKTHVNYGVVPEHYKTVGAALLWTLEQGLAEAFTDEVKQAWVAAYTRISTIMINAAQQV